FTNVCWDLSALTNGCAFTAGMDIERIYVLCRKHSIRHVSLNFTRITFSNIREFVNSLFNCLIWE
ncbi:hypothetical protein PMAYCL1PPCAC_11241, partial [Pristionchus mayeri]